MAQGREHPRFAMKSREPIGIGQGRVGRTLTATSRMSLRIVSPVDFAHAACAKQVDDLVRPDASSRCKAHARRSVYRNENGSQPSAFSHRAVAERREPMAESSGQFRSTRNELRG